ncbi:iron complex outermembrane receptor protein [Methylosinus sp. sav-2]|nr:iron complex outermembrane receptor protein [Methylosinus sp. sav-2]
MSRASGAKRESRANLLRSVGFASLAAAGVLAYGVVLAGPAAAQSAPAPAADAAVAQADAAAAANAQVDDVTVTARLREEKAQDVPLPVSVVGRKTAEREHIERLGDFAQKVPNFVPYVTNPRTSAMAIRGISGISGGADGSESAVGLIVDNVFYTHVGFQWADFVDLQSLEVARGPQGTLLGKNTTVGAVVIHTQLPSFTPEASFETSFANRSRIIEKTNISGPIIDDKLAYRVTFFLDKGDGAINDALTGADLLNNNRWGVRGQLYYVGDNFTDRLIFDRLRSDEYNNYSGVIGNSFPVWANGAVNTTYAQNLASRLHYPMLVNSPYSPVMSRLGNLDQRTTGVSNEINVQLGEHTLTAISAWREFILHPRNSLGNNYTQISGNAYDVKVDQYSQEVRLASPKDQTLEWQVGVYSLYETVSSYQHTDYGYQASQWLLNNFNANPALLNGTSEHTDGKARTFSLAEFGQATWHIDEQWSLTAGLRDTFEIRGGSDFGWASGVYTAAQAAAMQTAYGATFFDTGGQKATRNSLSGLINPSYKYSENILVYGSAARGEKSGAINTGALPITDSKGNFKEWQPVVTKPEVSWDYELGIKTNWFDNKLTLNGNLYWNDIYDFQSILVNTSIVDVTGVPLRKTYLGNIGHVRLRGFEFDGRWSPVERLSITLSGALTEARYINYKNAAPAPDWTWPTSANVNGVSAPLSVDLSGQRITGGVSGNSPVAPYSFNIGANYEHPLGRIFEGLGGVADVPVTAFVYGNLAWKYKTQLSQPGSLYSVFQPSYSVVNFGIGLRTDDDRYSLHFWAKNLFDQRYVVAQTIGTSTAAQTVTFGDNAFRAYGATLKVKLY